MSTRSKTMPPAGDTLPALHVYEARVVLRGTEGARRLPIGDFIVGPGRTCLRKGEILAGIEVCKPAGVQVHHFEKAGQRKAMAISIASMAVLLKRSPSGSVEWARFAWGSVGPTVVASSRVESLLTVREPSRELIERAALMVREDVRPIDDVRATAACRRVVAGNLLLRLLHSIAG